MKATRTAAAASGQKFYKTGKPCKRNHVAKRRTIDGTCQECAKANAEKDRVRIRSLLSNSKSK